MADEPFILNGLAFFSDGKAAFGLKKHGLATVTHNFWAKALSFWLVSSTCIDTFVHGCEAIFISFATFHIKIEHREF